MTARLGSSLAVIAAIGCGSASGADLFSPRADPGPSPGGGGGQALSGSGGGFFNPNTGGGDGSFDGAGGTLEGSGGGTSSGGGGGAGGFVASGGGGGLAGSAGSPSTCDFSGTWGSYVVAPVTWPASPLVLFAGTGSLQQWNLSEQHASGADVTAVTVTCGIFLPDLQSDFFGGFAKFGIRFPDGIFDSGTPSKATFVMKGKVTATGLGFDTEPFATLLGLSLDNPATAPWPAVAALKLVDHDLDQKPGITVVPAAGAGYSLPPSDLGGGQAKLIYIAERTVSSFAGTIVTCDEVHADVTIVSVAGKAGINSTVVGCQKVSGVECATADAAFIDANRPQYAASELGTLVSVRMPSGATCQDVRTRFPKQ